MSVQRTLRILLFAPHAEIDVHSLPEALVAQALQNKGHKLFYVTCNGVFENMCTVHSCNGLKFNDPIDLKRRVCQKCRQKRDIIVSEFNFTPIPLENYLNQGDLLALQDKLNKITPDDFYDTTLHQIPIGRIALYEFAIHHKLHSLTLISQHWDEYLVHFQNTYLVVCAAERLLRDIQPDRTLTYNGFYSVNHGLFAMSEQRGLPTYSLHAGYHLSRRLSQMTIFRGLLSQALVTHMPEWGEFKDLKLNHLAVEHVREHVKELFDAKSPWVYSTKALKNLDQVQKKIPYKANQKILLAIIASDDERFAANVAGVRPPASSDLSTFDTQTTWLKWLINWISDRSDLFLIIRVHPRLYPNKREGVLAPAIESIEKEFSNLPKNVHLNTPRDELSVLDLAMVASVGLNSSSSCGIEMLLTGMPVVIPARIGDVELLAYPTELNLVGTTPSEYGQKIELALERGHSLDNIVNVFRWLFFLSARVGIDIGDGYPVPINEKTLKDHFRCLVESGCPFEPETELFRFQCRHRNKKLQNDEILTSVIEAAATSHINGDLSWAKPFVQCDDDSKIIQAAMHGLISSKA